MDAGTYEVKLLGSKKPSRTVEWIYITQGETLNEWALWQGTNATFGNRMYNVTVETKIDAPHAIDDNGTDVWLVGTDAGIGSGGEIMVHYFVNGTFIDQKDISTIFGSIPSGIYVNGTYIEVYQPGNFSVVRFNMDMTLNDSFDLVNRGGFGITGNNSNRWVSDAINVREYDSEYASEISSFGFPTSRGIDYDNNGEYIWGMTPATAVANRTFVNGTWSGYTNDTNAVFPEGIAHNDTAFFVSTSVSPGDQFAVFERNVGDSGITLDSPIDGDIFLNEVIVQLTGTPGGGATIVNMSIWHNATGTFELNQSNTSITGLTNTTSFNVTFADGFYLIGAQGCDSDGDCVFTDNVTIEVSPIRVNSYTFNSSTFETASETYVANVTARTPALLTAASLNWNGTAFSGATQSGLEWSRTIDVPTDGNVNKTFKFDFTYDGSTFSSNFSNVQINDTNFTQCGRTGGDTIFLNISFQDEADSSFINASIPLANFTYFLGSGGTTKSLEYINNTNNFEYNFCALPNRTLNVQPNLQYKQGTSFPQRIWQPTVRTYTNVSTNQTLFLLGSIDGIFVTFQIINSADQTLSDVDVRVVRSIGGEDFEVGVGTTSEAGVVTFFLNPDFEHTITASKVGFTTKTTVLFPTQSSFTITLAGGEVSADNFFKGIEYVMFPQLSFLENDTTYDFEFNVTSSFWDLTDFGFSLRLKNGSIVTTETSAVSGTPATFLYDVNNQSIIYMDAFWNINNGNYTNVTKFWVVTNIEDTQWSIARFFTDLNIYISSGLFGLDDFGRYLIAFMVIFLAVGIVSFKYGLTSPLSVTTLIFTITFFFDVVVGLIPEIRGIPNVLTYISGLILVLAIFREAQR